MCQENIYVYKTSKHTNQISANDPTKEIYLDIENIGLTMEMKLELLL